MIILRPVTYQPITHAQTNSASRANGFPMKMKSGTDTALSLSVGSYQRKRMKTIIEMETVLKLLIAISSSSGTKLT